MLINLTKKKKKTLIETTDKTKNEKTKKLKTTKLKTKFFQNTKTVIYYLTYGDAEQIFSMKGCQQLLYLHSVPRLSPHQNKNSRVIFPRIICTKYCPQK